MLRTHGRCDVTRARLLTFSERGSHQQILWSSMSETLTILGCDDDGLVAMASASGFQFGENPASPGPHWRRRRPVNRLKHPPSSAHRILSVHSTSWKADLISMNQAKGVCSLCTFQVHRQSGPLLFSDLLQVLSPTQTPPCAAFSRAPSW
jgi:hypothetical protein